MKTLLIGLILGLVLGAAGVILVSSASQYNRSIVPGPTPSVDLTDVQVIVDEFYLGRRFAGALAEMPEYEDPALDFREPDLALVTVTTELAGRRARPTVWMRLGVQNEAVQIEVVQIEAGGLNVPLWLVEPQVTRLEQTLEEQINETVSRWLAGTDLRLQRLTVTETTLAADLGAVATTAVAGRQVERVRAR